ncbi:hypothetical protein KFK09_006862 [Dendrobium nobile]|uniref:Uncharacterized protein n=1 Tax=Dendrobium nobile TaxID=94219 RepID=A0A8T3BQA4_DENNO|nr:hypothetical protein KFK09_006862 [Dendrobium nobile]
MRVLGWMSGYTLRDRMQNKYAHNKVGEAPVVDKIREFLFFFLFFYFFYYFF